MQLQPLKTISIGVTTEAVGLCHTQFLPSSSPVSSPKKIPFPIETVGVYFHWVFISSAGDKIFPLPSITTASHNPQKQKE